MRKALLQYDDVINQQREYIYAKRNEILDSESIHETVLENIENFINNLVMSHIAPEGYMGSYCVRCVNCLTQSPFFTDNKEKAIEVISKK